MKFINKIKRIFGHKNNYFCKLLITRKSVSVSAILVVLSGVPHTSNAQEVVRGEFGSCTIKPVDMPSTKTKVIQNKEIRFQFKVPENYHTELHSHYKGSPDYYHIDIFNPEDVRFKNCLTQAKVKGGGEYINKLSIYITDIPSGVNNLVDLTNSSRYSTERSQGKIETEYLKIGGQDALLVRLWDGVYQNIYFFTPNRDKLFHIDLYNARIKSNSYSEKILRTVVSSFQFSTSSMQVRVSGVQSLKIQADQLLAQKQWGSAIAAYTQGIKISPRYAELYYNRGLSYLSSDNKKAALINFEEAAELFLQQGKWDDRKDAIGMITQIDPTLENDYKLTESSRLTLKGIGPVRIGMTIEEASKASGSEFIYEMGGGRDGSGTCSHYGIKGNPKGISFLVMGRIASIYILNLSIKTIRGIKIKDPETKIESIYADQLKVESGLIGGRMNRYIFIPKDIEDRSYRYIFESSNGRIDRFRSGKIPEVEYIEGCF